MGKRGGGECGLCIMSGESVGSAYGDKGEEEFCFFYKEANSPTALIEINHQGYFQCFWIFCLRHGSIFLGKKIL